jgi:hypothetical protein
MLKKQILLKVIWPITIPLSFDLISTFSIIYFALGYMIESIHGMKDDILVATSGMPKPQSTPIEFTPNINGKNLSWSLTNLCSRPPTSISYKNKKILVN